MKYFITLLMSCPLFLSAQVSNNMTLLDQWNPSGIESVSGVKFNDLWGYADNAGREYAIVGSAASIHIVDITDPTTIVEVDRVPGGQSTIWRDMKTYQDRIYAVSDNTSEGLIIMDATNLPDSVHVTYRSSEFFSRAHNIFIDEAHGKLYVAGSDGQYNGLVVLDISQNPDAPTLITKDALPGGGYVHDLYVNDDIVYASHGWNGLYIWDYSNPANIRLLADVETNGYNHSSWLTDDLRYLVYAEEVPSGVDMGVIDVTNLHNGDIEIAHLFKFPLLAPTHTNVTPHNPYIRDTMLIVSYYDDGTQIYDIGDPLDVEPYAHYDTNNNTSYNANGNWGTYPFLPSGNIISSDIRNGLFVMKMDDYDLASITYQPIFPNVSLSLNDDFDSCSGAPAELSASGGYHYYQWLKDGVIIPNQNSPTYSASESGLYQVIGLQGQKKIMSSEIMIQIAATPTIAIQNNVIEAMPSDGLYEWTANGETITLTSSTIMPGYSGFYQAARTIGGCTNISDSMYFFVPQALNIDQLSGLNVKLNTGNNTIEIDMESLQNVTLSMNLYNTQGQSLNNQNLLVNGFHRFEIPTEALSTGIYFLSIDNGAVQDSYKLFIP